MHSEIQGYKKKHLLTTGGNISELLKKMQSKEDDFILYIDGNFDLFNIGHI